MTNQELIDKKWDDEGVIPDTINPDTAYLIDQMTGQTLEAVDASPDELILDVGCGRALDLLSLGAKGAILFGFDGSRVMIERAAENFIAQSIPPRLACGSAENLPYADKSFNKVICKGAIDHFYDPGKAIQEMVRVLKPGGRLIISVANFSNLGFRSAKLYNRIHKAIKGRELSAPHIWDKPDDHVYEFNYPFLLKLIPEESRIDQEFGVSMFWGFPKWGKFLKILPARASKGILNTLNSIARTCPSLADVLVFRIERVPDEGNKSFEKKSEVERNEKKIGVKIMNKYSRIQGLVLCLVTFLAALLFLVGIFAKNWWALAIPVAIGFFWLLGLGFWIGWTLLTIQVEPQVNLQKD
ncbi:MAG: methyltransferase domain-containing protein [Deltaproteobacteria bacterium]|nr:methyltransferase domain-containing protein [Deltaproteobacteria bacterium]MBW2050628.1 methyltransferase domain-containing protein [Deltaproteobacteria bacterium]MBW2139478.1 methyltransferase domain-containing protein [Deltaproteobacteria bacterium]MBW2322227.1 methyltransferase domain-containing protein [Deltaproteobacteria bacterium]